MTTRAAALEARVEALEIRLAGLLAYLAEYAREAGMDDIAQGVERVDRPDLRVVE